MTTDDLPTKPRRAAPTVRKSTVITDSSTPAPIRGKKKTDPEFKLEKPKMSQNSKTVLLMLVAFIVGSLFTYGITKNTTPTPVASTSTFTDVIAGKVALTENELIDAVKKLGVDVYWAGPVDGAKYT